MTPTTTPTLFSMDAAKTLLESLPARIAEGELRGYRMLWDALVAFLAAHWFTVVAVLLVFFVVALVRALMGRWGMLGSVLYNYLYFGILFAIGSVFGSEAFVSNVFSVVATIALYPACYFTVGWLLLKTGLRNR